MNNAPNAQVRFVEPGQVELEARPVPAPGATQVLVRTSCSLISTGTETTHGRTLAQVAQGMGLEVGDARVAPAMGAGRST